MPNETETSQALTVLRETVVRKPDTTTQVSGTGTRLLRMMQSSGWTSATRQLSTADIIQISAVLICLDVLSQDIAKIPFRMYEKIPGGKRVVEYNEHPIAELLATRPNRFHTWEEFWEMVLLHLGMVQNAFVAKRMRGAVTEELVPCMPARTTILAVDPDRDSSGLGFYCYKVDRFSTHERIQLARMPSGGGDVFLPGEFMHFRGRMFDGLLGYSNLDAGAKVFGLSNEMTEYSTRLYSNDGGMRGVFQMPGESGDSLSEPAFERLRTQLAELMTNMRRHNVPIVLEEGMSFESISMKANEAEISTQRDAAVVDVARIFRMPPHKIMHLVNVKYENMETLEKSYVKDTLVPYCRRIEERMALSLLTREEQAKYFFEFDRKEMLLNDMKMLADVGKVMVQNGALELDELRAIFGWNPLANGAGQYRLIPSTFNLVARDNSVMIAAGAQPTGEDEPADDKKPAGKPKKDGPDVEDDENVVRFPVVGER